MRDLVFLFGAGASFGAGGIIPEPPPLGGQLYGELARIFPSSWGGLPAETKAKFRANFEHGMEEIYQRWGTTIPQLMREMATYFIQFRPITEGCLYRELIREFRAAGLIESVVLSTLNYECVLEFAMAQEGIRASYFEETPLDAVPVWKLHGSSNFFSQNLNVGTGILYSTGIAFEGGLQAFSSIEEVVQHCLVGTSLAPAMSLYMRGKPVAISPSTLQLLQRWWANAVQSAKSIVVVGVYPNPEDEHIWGALAKSPAHLGLASKKWTLIQAALMSFSFGWFSKATGEI